MARIQVLPLTTTTVGDYSATPYVLIIDRVTPDDHEMLLPFVLESRSMCDRLGAREVFIWEGELEVGNVDEELHRAAQAAVERALNPERTIEVA